MTRFSTEVTEIHGLLELSLAAFRTTDWMDFPIYQVFEQTSFKMGHNTIG
jgi:hypothetical protein